MSSAGPGINKCPFSRHAAQPQSSRIPACCSLPCLTQFLIQIWPPAQASAYFRYTSFCCRKKRPTQVTLKQGVYCGNKWGQECEGGGDRKTLGTGIFLMWSLSLKGIIPHVFAGKTPSQAWIETNLGRYGGYSC